jgi:hypothetical protein
MDVREIFMYPTKDKEWPVKMIIGIALSILPIVNFFCSGYAYRIFKAGLNRQPLAMPEWDDWGEIFIQGLIIFVLRLLYFLIPLLLMGSGTAILIFAFVFKDKSGYFPPGIVIPSVVLIGIGVLLAFLAAVLFPMALANYAKNNERFGAAFMIWEIVPSIIRVLDDYVIAFVLMVCVFFAFFVLCVIPYLGMLFALVLSFYLKYLYYYALFGSACSGAFEGEAQPAAPEPGR